MAETIGKLELMQDNELRALERFMEKTTPDLMRQLYPRIYETDGCYYSAKLLAAYLAANAMDCAQSGRSAPEIDQAILATLGAMINRRMPLLFVDPLFLEAVERTDFQHDIDWIDLKLPYEEGVLMLPRDVIPAPDGGDAGYIQWARWRPDRIFESVVSSFGPLHFDSAGWGFMAAFWVPRTGLKYHLMLNSQTCGRTLRLDNVFSGVAPELQPVFAVAEASAYEEFIPPHMRLQHRPGDKEFSDRMARILFGVMLALQARPGLLERERLQRIVPAKRDTPRREFWTPNVLGKGWRPKQQAGPIGSHATPRMHWRRGHWRNQAFGPGLTEHRVIWLEPMLVAAPDQSAKVL